MTDAIQPFHRVPTGHMDVIPAPARGLLLLMRLHFLLAWLVILTGAVALVVLAYPDLNRAALSSDLRVTGGSDLYAVNTQLMLGAALALGLLSLVPWQAAGRLGRRSGHLWLPRGTAIVLLAGIPAGFLVWQYVARLPLDPAARTTVQQVVADVAWPVRAVAVLLALQGVLGAWYLVWLGTHRAALCLRNDAYEVRRPLRRLGALAVGMWLVTLLALGLALGVATGWAYEIPVPEPAAGTLLYATTFDDFNGEWDTFPGRDSAAVVRRDATSLGPEEPGAALTGPVLLISYGAGLPEEVIWSALNRKFGDFDLRVTVRQVSGPVDQNQYGVVFRYRDADDFYIFEISSDGYYTLKKVIDGVQELVSAWTTSDAIRQDAANEIRVAAHGNSFRFFVNGVPVPLCLKGENMTSMWGTDGECLTDERRWVFEDDALVQGQIALAAGTIDGSDVAVAFDDVVVVGPSRVDSDSGAE